MHQHIRIGAATLAAWVGVSQAQVISWNWDRFGTVRGDRVAGVEAEGAEAVGGAVRRGEELARGALRAVGAHEGEVRGVRFCEPPESEISHGGGG